MASKLKIKRTGKSHYTEHQKITCVAHYAALGNLMEVSRLTEVPEQTLRMWKSQPWWYEAIQKIKEEQYTNEETKFGRIIKQAQNRLLERLDKGDVHITKDGQSILKPINGKDVAVILSVAVEKRDLIDKKKNTSNDLTTNERLEKLFESFIKFTKAKEITVEPESELIEYAQQPIVQINA